MSDENYLDEFVEDSGTAMTEVMRLVDALIEAQARVEEAEEELSNRKQLERTIREQTIPSYMAQHRLTSLGLENGKVVTISEELALSMPKDEAKKRAVIGFLYANEGGDLVKERVSFEDADEEILGMLQDKGITFERSEDVNTNSLKAWFRRKLGLTANTVAQFSTQEVPPEANLYLYRNTKITNKKGI